MHRFYVPDLTNNPVELPKDEAVHAGQVMRKKVGDHIGLIDGQGHFAEAEIIAINKRNCTVSIIEKVRHPPIDSPFGLAIAPTKTNERWEWALEKATELGVTHIFPFFSHHSERRTIKPERIQRVLLSATKQSMRYYLPTLHEAQSFEATIEATKAHSNQCYIAYCGTDQLPHLKQCALNLFPILFIGPEGDFSPEEYAFASANEVTGVSLGTTRLRTETAAVAGATLLAWGNI